MVTLPERVLLSSHTCQTYVSWLCLEVQIRQALEWVQSCLPPVWCQENMWLCMMCDILYKAEQGECYIRLVVWCDIMWLPPCSMLGHLCQQLYWSKESLGSNCVFSCQSKDRASLGLFFFLQYTNIKSSIGECDKDNVCCQTRVSSEGGVYTQLLQCDSTSTTTRSVLTISQATGSCLKSECVSSTDTLFL